MDFMIPITIKKGTKSCALPHTYNLFPKKLNSTFHFIKTIFRTSVRIDVCIL